MRLVSVASLLALALTTTALAGQSAVKEPSQLILARTDFPAGTKYTWGQMPANYIQALAKSRIKAKAAYYYAEVRGGGFISGIVTTTGSGSQAQRLYNLSKADMQTSKRTPIRLPSYGDEQIALVPTKIVDKVEVLVRKNRMVWEVEAKLGVPKATLIAEIKKYASKQQRRIGAG